MNIDEYAAHDAVALAALVRRGEVSPDELLDAAIARVEQLNPRLNAVIDRLDDRARAALGRGLPDGPLRGVPFLIKDMIPLEGATLSMGSVLLRNNVAPVSHRVIERLEQAGLVIFGRTNAPEFGLVPTTEPALYGPTHNPWDPEHTPGGSSGGPAAAVAARMVPVAHGNDGGGSIRIPASHCGLFGLKPSRGRNPQRPVDEPDGFTANHVLSRTVRDSAILLDATRGAEPGDRFWAPDPERPYAEVIQAAPPPLRVAWTVTDFSGQRAHPDCVAAVEQTVRLLEDLGHPVEEAAPAIDGGAFGEAFMVLWSMIVGMVFKLAPQVMAEKGLPGPLAKILGQRKIMEIFTGVPLAPLGKPGLEKMTRRLSAIEAGLTPADAWIAWQTLLEAGYALADFFASYDLLLSPVVAGPPWRLGHLDENAPIDALKADLLRYVAYTPIGNTAGTPAMSVPLHWNDQGLPIGVQLMAPWPREDRLFALAAQLERARPWADRKPPVA